MSIVYCLFLFFFYVVVIVVVNFLHSMTNKANVELQTATDISESFSCGERTKVSLDIDVNVPSIADTLQPVIKPLLSTPSSFSSFFLLGDKDDDGNAGWNGRVEEEEEEEGSMGDINQYCSNLGVFQQNHRVNYFIGNTLLGEQEREYCFTNSNNNSDNKERTKVKGKDADAGVFSTSTVVGDTLLSGYICCPFCKKVFLDCTVDRRNGDENISSNTVSFPVIDGCIVGKDNLGKKEKPGTLLNCRHDSIDAKANYVSFNDINSCDKKGYSCASITHSGLSAWKHFPLLESQQLNKNYCCCHYNKQQTNYCNSNCMNYNNNNNNDSGSCNSIKNNNSSNNDNNNNSTNICYNHFYKNSLNGVVKNPSFYFSLPNHDCRVEALSHDRRDWCGKESRGEEEGGRCRKNSETSLFSFLPTFSPTSFVRAYVGESGSQWEGALNNRPALIVSSSAAMINIITVFFLQHHVIDTRDHIGLFVIGAYMVLASYYMAYYFLERYAHSFACISHDKKFYTIANLIKAGILFSIVPFATLHLYNIILFDTWDTNILRNLGCIYTIPDFVSMFVVRRMGWSTWAHHFCVVLFNFFSIMNDYGEENICRSVVVYAAFSSFAYCVNVLLASRFLGISHKVARVLSFVSMVVYFFLCAINWTWQVYYIRKLIVKGKDHWTVYAYIIPFSLVIYDDIILNRWLFNNAKNNVYAYNVFAGKDAAQKKQN